MSAIDISTTLAPARLQRFVVAAGGDLELGLQLYRWNVQLASAYWTPLHFVEVAVRNAVHHAMAESSGNESWFENPAVVGHGAAWMYPIDQDAIAKAIEKLHPPFMPGQVVAELGFGFWVRLLSGTYRSLEGGTNYHDAIWVKGGVSKKFGGAKRGVIHKRLERIRRFRNRIAHHEHLLNENFDTTSNDIDSILRALSPSTATWVDGMSDVAAIRAARPC